MRLQCEGEVVAVDASEAYRGVKVQYNCTPSEA